MLRPYQQQAVEAVYDKWREYRKVVYIAATGTGKSHVIGHIAAHEAQLGNRTLVLAHRDEIIRQNADKLKAGTGWGCGIEKAQEVSTSADMIVQGSIQTMSKPKRLERFVNGYFQVVIIDECHRSNAATYRRVIDHFANSRILGVSATANMRSDKKNLGEVYDCIAYEYPLKQAVKDKWLCKIIAQTLPIDIDLTQCRKVAGDFKDDELGSAIEPYLSEIARQMKPAIEQRKTVVFLPLIRTSLLFEQHLKDNGITCMHIDGKSKDRKEILQAFTDNKFQVLLNSCLLTEGWDMPSLSCVVILKPTQSKQAYFQMIGRGTRTSPDTGKENLLLLDFLWLTSTHSLVVRPAKLLARSEEVEEQMTKRMVKGGVFDLEDMEGLASGDVQAQREAKLARIIDLNKHRKAGTLDPLAHALVTHDEELQTYEATFQWHKEPATEKQVATLAKFKFDGSNMTKGFASALLDNLFKRIEKEMATPGQLGVLAKFKYTDLDQLSFKEASARIDEIAKNNWQRRDW